MPPLELESNYSTTTIAQNTSQAPRNAYLFGHPIGNSLAPAFHNTIFSALNPTWHFHLLDSLNHSDFLRVMHSDDFIGAAITTPHKVTFLKEVDEVIPHAQIIGAINTIFVRLDASGQRRYIGTNTDCYGVRDALVENYPQVMGGARGKPGLVIGGGGAARSAVYALAELVGSSVIYLVNRDKSETESMIAQFQDPGFQAELLHITTVAHAEALEAPVVVIGAIPDTAPSTPGERIARDLVVAFLSKEKKGVLVDMCYTPSPRTELAQIAQKAGWTVIPGTEVMVFQGIAQDLLWTERPVEELPVQAVTGLIRDRVSLHSLQE
jgi:quinate dehydrogenase